MAETKELSPLEAVTDHLRKRRLLLVLDNFEQVIEAAPIVAGLLEAAPDIRILVTSRSPLHLYGEQQFPVSPLRLPDLARLPPFAELREYEAVRLFVDRARIARPGFEITEANASTIAAITARLDGLPAGHRAGGGEDEAVAAAGPADPPRASARDPVGGSR